MSIAHTNSRPYISDSPGITPVDSITLFGKYPLFFRAIVSVPLYRCPLAHWGIECGNGWYSIIDEAASKIELELEGLLARYRPQLMHRLRSKRRRSIDVIWDLAQIDQKDHVPEMPLCAEIKEQMGLLRLYIQSGQVCDGSTWRRICAIANEAERKSETTCERCGQPGFMRRHTWGRVYCNECSSRA